MDKHFQLGNQRSKYMFTRILAQLKCEYLEAEAANNRSYISAEKRAMQE
jgi:hypothetical protein